MTRRELQSIRYELESRLGKLKTTMSAQPDLAVDASPDAIDEAQWRVNLDTAVQVLNADAGFSEQIESALNRIVQGDYGACEHCGEAISLKRLQAIPWATACISCQEELEDEARRSAG